MSNKLLKHMAIARSGIYMYRKEELPSLGISSIPDEFRDYPVFGVYRPATVLARRAPLFSRLPITVEHPSSMLNPANVDLYMKGYTGDTVDVVMDSTTDEVYLVSSMTLVSSDAIQAYDSNIREVSPGYTPVVEWKTGKHHDEDFQLMVTDITDVNHLAITRKARGGSATCIFDSEGGSSMKDKKFFSGLWRFLKKKAKGTEDTELGAARRILMEIAGNKDAMSDGEIAKKVGEVQDSAMDLPDCEDKSKLNRFLEDFKQSKMMDPASVKDAAEMISTLFETLDSTAMAEIATEAKVLEPVTKTHNPSEKMEGTEAPTGDTAKVDAPEEKAKVEDTAEVEAVGTTSLTEPAQSEPGTKNVGEDSVLPADDTLKQILSLLHKLVGTADAAKVEETKKEEEGTKDSFGVTATLGSTDSTKENKSLSAFMQDNFGL